MLNKLPGASSFLGLPFSFFQSNLCQMSLERVYPDEYAHEVNDLLGWNVDDWRDITEDWEDELKDIIRDSRTLPLEMRVERGWNIYRTAQNLKDEGDKGWAESVSIYFNLTDKTLDLIIS